jgi:uncharacterized repeat protein (TIGR03803 family)
MSFRSAGLQFLNIVRSLVVGSIGVMALLPVAAGQTPVTIYNFNGIGDVTTPVPYGVMVQGRDGNIYGTAHEGGAFGGGGVYVVTPAGKESVIFSFPLSYGTSCQPGLTLGNDGNLYGDCNNQGANGFGLLYKVTPKGVLTELHNFTNTGGDGANPNGPPVAAKDGNLYGPAQNGGANGQGTIYKITPSGTVTTFYSFLGGSGGSNPSAPLIQGSDGNLYGSTLFGGTNGAGTIFKLSLAGVLTTLHTFNFTDGFEPIGALVQGTNGSFYGTTYQGGVNNQGTAFRITASGQFTLLHSFAVATDGMQPETALVQATDGNFYGTTNPYLDTRDTIFKITPGGAFSVVYQFDGTSSTLGIGLANGLVQHTNGLLYGATNASTGPGNGSIYKLSLGGKAFVRTAQSSGAVGASIGMFGQGFSSSSVVKFGGVLATGAHLQGTTYLTVPVPVGALTGSVTVTTGSTVLTSNVVFKVTPKITSFSPAQGAVGTSVVINGSSFTQATKVTFGGVAATNFTVNSDIKITAKVPTGAVTGKIAVTTPGGTATSATNFTVQ